MFISGQQKVLIKLIVAQFAATSLWFAGNAIYADVQVARGILQEITPTLTIAVQVGFIIGTLVYAIWMIPDRYSPAKVFLVSGILAAFSNLLMLLDFPLWGLFFSRFLVGFFLAGIYPVGMKIASDWYKKNLGSALGFLVGALVLGTSFPHFLKARTTGLPWELVVMGTSLLALLGGFLVYFFVGDGPNRKKAAQFSFGVFKGMFKNQMFNRASFGYFGHMWELYAFWAFVPLMISFFNSKNGIVGSSSFYSFLVIAIGALGCVVGGLLSKKYGSCRIAFFAMLTSALCALSSGFIFGFSPELFLAILMIWGFAVIADSPQFSSVIADYADPRYLGSALTIVNSIGFALTVLSIELMDRLSFMEEKRFWFLAIGPILGLIPTGKIAFRKNFPKL